MQSDFSEDICTILLKKAEQFALSEVTRQKWRGARGGVLPDGLLSNEPDLAPILTEDGETASLVEIVPTAQPGPAEELLANEEGQSMERLQRQFNDFLSEDQPVKDLFGCLCDGITKRAAIARKLGLPVRQVKNASIRLKRRLAEFKKRF